MDDPELTKRILDRTDSYEDLLIESLRDREYAKAYLQMALDEYQENGNVDVLMLSLRDVAKAQGSLEELAKSIKIKQKNPQLKKLGTILKNMGFHRSAAPIAI
jgi:DNA-binding phage protein